MLKNLYRETHQKLGARILNMQDFSDLNLPIEQKKRDNLKSARERLWVARARGGNIRRLAQNLAKEEAMEVKESSLLVSTFRYFNEKIEEGVKIYFDSEFDEVYVLQSKKFDNIEIGYFLLIFLFVFFFWFFAWFHFCWFQRISQKAKKNKHTQKHDT